MLSPARSLVATPYRRGVVVLVLVTVAFRAWTTARWTWQDDDWVYLADAATMPLLDYVLQTYHGHLMPGEFLVMWVITRAAPLDHTIAVALTATAAGAVVALWGRALAKIAGEPTWLLAPLGLLAMSPLMIRPTIWWASALQVLPLQACMAWGVLVAATIARAPSRQGTGQLVVALLVAVLFWEKSVLVVIPWAMVLLSASEGRVVARIRRHALTLQSLAVVAVAYVGLYVLSGRSGGTDQDELGVTLDSPPTLREALDFVVSGFGSILAPSTFGGPWGSLPAGSEPFSVAPAAVRVLSGVALLLAVALVVASRRQAWIPLVTATAYVLVSWSLVLLSSRYSNLGNLAINDERYTVDAFSVLVLAFVLSAVGPRRPVPGLHGSLTEKARGAGGVLVVAVAFSLAIGNALAVSRVGVHPGRKWVDALLADIQHIDAVRDLPSGDQKPIVLWDDFAPDTVLQTVWWNDAARLSSMLSSFRDSVAFGVPADQMYQVDAEGRIVPVEISRVSSSKVGPDPGCGYLVEPGDTVSVPMSTALFHWGWGLEVTAFTATGADLDIDLGTTETTVTMPSGQHTRAIQVEGEVPQQVAVRLPEDAAGPVCLNDLHVGEPEAVS